MAVEEWNQLRAEKANRSSSFCFVPRRGGGRVEARTYLVRFKRSIEEHVAEELVTILSNFRLLSRIAVVLEREDDRIVGRFECRLGDRLDDVAGRNFRHERVPVHDDRLVRLAVPEVQLHAPASGQQALTVHLDRGFARQLMSWQKGKES